jgi:hypothetical protein
VADDLRLLPVETIDFHRAAMLTLDAASASVPGTRCTWHAPSALGH